jgi:hypothetical protein
MSVRLTNGCSLQRSRRELPGRALLDLFVEGVEGVAAGGALGRGGARGGDGGPEGGGGGVGWGWDEGGWAGGGLRSERRPSRRGDGARRGRLWAR